MRARWDNFIDVNTGEVKVGMEGTLRSLAIGSCVVVAAYDCQKGIGALAHVMLPRKAPEKAPEKTKYAADAIDEMIKQMAGAGGRQEDIEVCLVGGGNVLQKDDDTVCQENIKSANEILEKKQIPIRASTVGGTQRKSVFLEVESGSIFCAVGDEQEKLLWKAGS